MRAGCCVYRHVPSRRPRFQAYLGICDPFASFFGVRGLCEAVSLPTASSLVRDAAFPRLNHRLQWQKRSGHPVHPCCYLGSKAALLDLPCCVLFADIILSYPVLSYPVLPCPRQVRVLLARLEIGIGIEIPQQGGGEMWSSRISGSSVSKNVAASSVEVTFCVFS